MVSLPGLRSRKVVPQRTAGELDAMAAAGALVAAALKAEMSHGSEPPALANSDSGVRTAA